MDGSWYYAEGDKSVGPISLADLRSVLSLISDASRVLVWRNGFTGWMTAGEVPELAPYVIKPPPLPVASRGTFRVTPVAPTLARPPDGAELAVRNKPAGLHPWRRFFARMIDLYIFVLLFFFVLGILFPELFEPSKSQATSRGNDYLYTLPAVAAYTIFETICLNLFGSTFGKFLYGIRLTTKEGDQLTFTLALKRSLAVWVRGLGFSIPIVTLITLIVAYRTLSKDKETSWDRDFNCVIVHREWSILRWLAIAVAWLLFFSVYAILIEIGTR